jgi:hypothetical protein
MMMMMMMMLMMMMMMMMMLMLDAGDMANPTGMNLDALAPMIKDEQPVVRRLCGYVGLSPVSAFLQPK